MENSDIRWKQRFQNFEKAIGHLADKNLKEHIDRIGIRLFPIKNQ